MANQPALESQVGLNRLAPEPEGTTGPVQPVSQLPLPMDARVPLVVGYNTWGKKSENPTTASWGKSRGIYGRKSLENADVKLKIRSTLIRFLSGPLSQNL